MIKQITLLSLLALFTAGNIANAMDITNGTLISHKETNNGEFTSSFHEFMHTTKQITAIHEIYKVKNPNLAPEFIEASDTLNNVTLKGTTKAPTTISSTEYLSIINSSKVSQTFTITSNVCVEAEAGTGPAQCSNSSDVVQLDPRGTLSITRSPSLTNTFSTAGNYITTAGLEVQKGDLDTHYFTVGELSIKKS